MSTFFWHGFSLGQILKAGVVRGALVGRRALTSVGSRVSSRRGGFHRVVGYVAADAGRARVGDGQAFAG